MTITFESIAQFSKQVIKGIVTDQQTLIPIIGATLTVVNSKPLNNGTSDDKGYFRISNLNPGRYDIKVTSIGYNDIIIPNVVVTAGKEVELDVQLKTAFHGLQEVVISGKKIETLNQMTTVSGRSFSMEEVNRFSGGRSDPARLVASFAGVSAPDDYKNDIVIRGNSPTGVLWRLEGLNIPSPNHFSSLAATGAPVTLLNTNVLRNSDFFTSAYPAEYGNAVAGVFDMNMRNGNAEKREHSLQFGMLTGLEAVTEGPIKEGNNSSYLIAYRYAFTGLAKEIGIDLGTNALPKFQDISFKLNSGNTSLGNFNLFGMGGTSNIDLLHDKIDATDIFADPNRDMYTKSRIGIIGLKHTIYLNNNAYWNTTIGASYSGNKTKDDIIKEIDEKHRVREANTSETRFSGNTFINYRISPRITLKAGAQIDVFNLNLLLRDRELTPDWNYLWRENSTSSLLSSYLQSNIILSSRLTLNAGLRSQYLTLNKSNSLEPRLGLKYKVNRNNSFSAGYGAHSQMQPFNIYSFRAIQADGSYDETNKNLGFTNSQHFVLAYDLVPLDDWRIKVETYYQILGNVPVSRTPNSFSMLNEGGSYRETEVSNLLNDGEGKNYGVELTLEKFFSKGYYALFTGSLYKAKYKGSDNIERETVFSGNYVYNLLAGKEFKIGKRKSNAFFMDMKLTHAGGRPYTPVDLEASRLLGKEVLKGDDYTNIYRYSDFFRLDFKLGITLNSKKKTISHSLYYDFQNITNNKNVFASQYNNVTKEVNTSYQMGLMPNFVYRVLF